MIHALIKVLKTKQLKARVGKIFKIVIYEGIYIKTSKEIYCFDNDGFYII